MRILATSWTKQRKSRSKTPLLRCAKRSRAMTTMPLRDPQRRFPTVKKWGQTDSPPMKSTPKLSACAVPEKRPNKRRKGFCQKGVVCMKKCDYCQNLGCVVDFGTADMWGVTDETLFY